jgi:hypothetical protein
MARRIIIIGMLMAVLVPTVAFAAPSFLPLVPCGASDQPPCTPCYLFQAVKNFSDLVLYGITGPVAAFMFVFAGGMILLYGANPSMLVQGKKLATNTALGIIVILLAWLATNFLIKNIATGNTSNKWFEFTCPDFLASITAGDILPPPVTPIPLESAAPASYRTDVSKLPASDLQMLAEQNHTKYPYGNSPDLVGLVNCLYADPVVAALALPKPDMTGNALQSGIYTYENDNVACNYTRGKSIGPGCQHSVNSCHYGGEKGTGGAEAVDMNAKHKVVSIPGTNDGTGKPVQVYATDELLFCRLNQLLVVQKKCPFKLLNWESDHTHISTKVCDADGVGGVQATKGLQMPTCGYGTAQ